MRTAQRRRLTRNAAFLASVTLVFAPQSPLWCQSGEVVFIRSIRGNSSAQEKLAAATRFYGLNLNVRTASADGDDLELRTAVQRNETLAVAIAADAMPQVKEQELFRALSRKSGNDVPLLILGVTPETAPNILAAWSGSAAIECRRLPSLHHPQYAFRNVPGFTKQLGELRSPASNRQAFYFVLADNRPTQVVAEVRDGKQVFPVFIEVVTVGGHKVFLDSTTSPASDGVDEIDNGGLLDTFASIAPAVMFIKNCAGERGWHALHNYANFTIDDPWLREPYGHLNYSSLLGEMERHNFHTTIAFIPWNYDRSQPDVVSLIRQHPQRYSICIHGDNHDHQEFADFQSKSLPVQVAAVRESLDRMAKFQELTGIPYDKVMVFPHNIGSAKILEALKRYNFLATINSSNVPLDGIQPAGPLFTLRPVALLWSDFPSVARYSATLPDPTNLIAIGQFLDNPLLFYTHQEFFSNGIGSFDSVADRVNAIGPDTRWRGLAEIIRNLYLVRLRNDSAYDVLAFSNSLSIENVHPRECVFYVRKQEAGSEDGISVSVDGRPYPFQMQAGFLETSITVPAGKTRNLEILFANDLGSTTISDSKHSLRVRFLRMASDFRDITLSKYALGETIVNAYYEGGRARITLIFAMLGAFLCCAWGCWKLRAMRRTRSALS